jgi:N-acetylglucosamine-6-phosphate deacetylase
MQINGGFGCDFSRNPEEAEKVAKGIVQYGVTSFLPTLVSSSPAQYKQSLPLLQPKRYEKGAEILGIHLEGPFFAERYKGAHNPQLLISSINCPVEDVYGDLEGVKIVTLAPELSGAKELIHYLKAHQIIVSAGHSAATYEQMLEGIQAGVGLTTHLFNAPFSASTIGHHRRSFN